MFVFRRNPIEVTLNITMFITFSSSAYTIGGFIAVTETVIGDFGIKRFDFGMSFLGADGSYSSNKS